MLEIYIWAACITVPALVRDRHVSELEEWATASLAATVWPAVIVIRLYRAAVGVRRG